MSYGAGVTQDTSSGVGSTFRDPLVFYDPDLTSGNTQATDFAFDDLTLPSQQSHLPLTDISTSQQHVNILSFIFFN
jgi:hypothetical protein